MKLIKKMTYKKYKEHTNIFTVFLKTINAFKDSTMIKKIKILKRI